MAEKSTALEELVQRVLEAHNNRDAKAAAEYYEEGAVVEELTLGRSSTDLTGIRVTCQEWFDAIPDTQVESNAILSAGDRVALVYTMSGTFRGVLPGLEDAVIGSRFTVQGCVFWEIGQSGKIIRETGLWDLDSARRQIHGDTTEASS
ncbi:hypothetical protein GCM10010245_90550 [Streptomyces spectabilis]|uniref:Steroid delta-isomerase-like uncharacterized protein n=1 Tax=Streptomyces spectabilis TaxID=68270 RepID=A0A7W8EZL0_STRST|nr:ester cyclase [Streptomyces spectabilis]MBB5110006.1 steroid delta-isomerase-like uncharacterized protein [Streptomyces spectabilis]GGV57449.1 hypothetical protein GCM10010245_90550 [Streptomyces spectabilis]